VIRGRALLRRFLPINAGATNEGPDSSPAARRVDPEPKEAQANAGPTSGQGAKDFGDEYDSGPTPAKDSEATKISNDEATNALSEISLRGAATGFASAAASASPSPRLQLPLAMRVGLLTRFWGSLGMALGVAALLLLVQFSMIFFIYFGAADRQFAGAGHRPGPPAKRFLAHSRPKSGGENWNRTPTRSTSTPRNRQIPPTATVRTAAAVPRNASASARSR